MIARHDHHSILVKHLYLWVRNRCESSGLCYSISVDHIGDDKPPLFFNSVPDVFAITDDKQVVIGEAETARGLLDRHTYIQLKELLLGCTSYSESLFVLAVPWFMGARAKTIVKQLKKELNAEYVKTVIIEALID